MVTSVAHARTLGVRRIRQGPREFTRRGPFGVDRQVNTSRGRCGCRPQQRYQPSSRRTQSASNHALTTGSAFPRFASSEPRVSRSALSAIGEALRLAQEADLDLVEVAPDARPPVCKLMDYGKFKYESAQKAREARRNQVLTVIKEMKLRPKIDCARLRDQEGSRRSLPQGRGQGQGHHHVPRSGAVPSRARVPVAAAAVRRCRRAGVRGERAQAGRPEHDHGPGPAQAGRGQRQPQPAASRQPEAVS